MNIRSFNRNKLKIKLLALFVSLIFVLGAGEFVGDSLATENSIEVNKKVVSFDEAKGICNIEMSVKGQLMDSEKAADIVLCIDTSGSMNEWKTLIDPTTKLDNVKSAAKEFCKTLTDSSTGNLFNGVRVGICEFYNSDNFLITKASERADYVKVEDEYYKAGDLLKGSSADGKNICNLTNDLSAINTAINNLNTNSLTSTNMQAGIECAGNMFGDSKNKKYIVLFTDGYPTISNGHGFGKSIGDVYTKDSSGEYILKESKVEDLAYANIFVWNGLSSSWLNDRHFTEAKKAYDSLLTGSAEKPAKYKDEELKFYAVADTSGLDKEDENIKVGHTLPYDMNSEYGKAIRLLQSINNTGGVKELSNIDQVSKVFNEIAGSINDDSGKAMIRDGRIEDVIPEEFILPTEAEIKAQLDSELKKGTIKDIKIDNGSRKITFILGTVQQTEVKFVYGLKVNNEYFYGANVPTNKEAKLYYKEPDLNITEEKTKDFPVPQVTINPKVCSIDVEKKIVNSSGNQINPDYRNNELDIEENSGQLDETYPILLSGDKGKFNFKVYPEEVGSETNLQSVNFIMKDDETNLAAINTFLNNYTGFNEEEKKQWDSWSKLGYLTVGTYKVSEVVPMNYNLNRIIVTTTKIDDSVIEDVYEGDNLQNAKIEFNSSIKHIKIVVENRKVNKDYWFDKSECDNVFRFSGLKEKRD